MIMKTIKTACAKAVAAVVGSPCRRRRRRRTAEGVDPFCMCVCVCVSIKRRVKHVKGDGYRVYVLIQ